MHNALRGVIDKVQWLQEFKYNWEGQRHFQDEAAMTKLRGIEEAVAVRAYRIKKQDELRRQRDKERLQEKQQGYDICLA